MKRVLIVMLVVVMSLSAGFSNLELNYIHFDPAIISAGDEVDIVVQYSANDANFENSQIGDKDYTYEVKLLFDDDLSKKYVRIIDAEGDDVKGTIYSGDLYYKVFRVKVATDAPAASYEFKLVGRWYRNGIAEDLREEVSFFMPVKREGIVLDVSSITTLPSQVHPNDKFVEIRTSISNTGSKDAKSIEVELLAPKGIEASYSNNNRFWIGSLKSFESSEVVFYVNLDENLTSGVYDLNFSLNYMDLDDNRYSKSSSVPFLVKGRPFLEIVRVEGSTLAGDKSQLKVWVKNVGEKSAESVDVRVLKQNSQPFEFDARSSYIGELDVGEEGLAVFEVDTMDFAEVKIHFLKLLIRAKGDSDEGDDTIYTFNRKASFDVTGVAKNYNVFYGGIGAFLVVSIFGFNMFRRGKRVK